MKNISKPGIIIFLVGLASLFLFGTVSITLRLVIMVIGIIIIIRSSQNREAITLMFLGALVSVVGILMTLAQTKDKVSGVYIVNGIPIPILWVTAAAVFVGFGIFVVGLGKLRK